MFVELGVQTSLTMLDKRWVGNWWLGFAIFGAICVFWSIWLLGFPKEFPLTKKQRETELCEATETKVVGYVYRLFFSFSPIKEIYIYIYIKNMKKFYRSCALLNRVTGIILLKVVLLESALVRPKLF